MKYEPRVQSADDWLRKQGGKPLSEVNDGETAYTIAWGFIKLDTGNMGILHDTPSMSFPIGTMNVMVKRDGDSFHILDGEPEYTDLWRYNAVQNGVPYFEAIWKPLTDKEKLDILWKERKERRS